MQFKVGLQTNINSLLGNISWAFSPAIQFHAHILPIYLQVSINPSCKPFSLSLSPYSLVLPGLYLDLLNELLEECVSWQAFFSGLTFCFDMETL